MAGKRDNHRRIAFLVFWASVLLTAACASDPIVDQTGYVPPDVPYVWPDEGAPPIAPGVEGVSGFVGPHKATQVAIACAALSSCADDVAVDECMGTVREYWRYRDRQDAGRIFQTVPGKWAPEPLSVATQIDCVASAGDCDSVRSCISTTLPCGGCSGDSLIGCRDPEAPLGYKIDCAALSLQCVETALDFSASCGVGTCNLTEATCEETRWLACELGIKKEIDCATGNLICETDGSENAQCQGKSGPCSAENDGGVCAGSLARNCEGGGWHEEDCAQLGDVGSHRCDVREGAPKNARCIFDDGCDPDTYDTTCEGSVMNLCPYGRPITIDCASLSLGECMSTPVIRCLGTSD